MKRIFVAIDISDEARAKTANYTESLRDEFPQVRIGWERAEKLHLTLKFLGEVDEKQLAKLTAAVEETAQQLSNFKLQITETGAFPSKRNARILWLGVHGETENLQELNKILEKECEKKGFAREKRNFKAHLTIARLREPHKSKKLVEGHLGNEFNSPEFQVFKIAIYESRLQKTGSIYNKIKNVELKIQNQ
ncbi:MAG TPA: RNA 2',3'-cyclic phosphodiesterase [Pyrinomonadaceae bacterium]|nr:RNA 2',3'-cyclic phosphodiesterase [Pyrinomonadaceae bacterium]